MSRASTRARSRSTSACSTPARSCSSAASAPPTWAPIRRCWSRRSWSTARSSSCSARPATGCRSFRVEQVGERELALMLLLREDEPHGPRRRRRDALDRARADRGGAAARLRPRRDPSADDPGVPQVEPHRPGDRGQGGERRAVHRRPGAPARRRLRRDVVRDARARRGVQRRARRRRRAHRRRARRLGRADRGAGVRCAGRGGGVPARRRAVEADGVQRRRARPRRRTATDGSPWRRARPRPRSR